MDPEIALVRADDGVTSELRLFRAAARAKTAAFVLPAMGVEARYYDVLARALRDAGLHVAVGELRGNGSSSVRAARSVDFGYADLIERDWRPTLDELRRRLDPERVIAVGHSLGGHVHALAAARLPAAVDGLVLVASGSVDYRGFPWRSRPLVLAGTQLAGLAAQLFGYFPGARVGFGGREGRRLTVDWARLARTGRFRPTGASIDYEAALAQLRLPVLAIDIAGDYLAPASTVEQLCRKLAAARADGLVERWQWQPTSRRGNWHFKWAREPQAIAGRVAAWSDARTAVSRAIRGATR